MIAICIAVFALTATMYAEETPPIAAFFLATGYISADGIDKGTPLPDGTEVKVYWDWDENGPDAKDPQPVVGDKLGEANFNSFKLNGAEIGLQPGQFMTDPMFNVVGALPKPSTFYLRVCVGDKQLVSNVVKLSSGLADYEFKKWVIDPTPCKKK